MQEVIDVLRDISQLRRDLAVYHDTLVAHNILQEHCDNQRKELAALNAAHAPIKGERDAYKRQCERLVAENAKLRRLCAQMARTVECSSGFERCALFSECEAGEFEPCLYEQELRGLGVEVPDE